jgi:hypothetical protein
MRGNILTAEHNQYNSARRVWNGLVAEKPGVIVQCHGVADVLSAVNFALEHHLQIFAPLCGRFLSG